MLKSTLALIASILLGSQLAQASIVVAPTELKMTSSGPTEPKVDEVEIHNPGDVPIHVSTTVTDWNMNRLGDYQFVTAGTSSDSCAPWIQVKPAEFSVAPHQSLRVRVSINPTQRLTQEQRAMLFFQAHMPPPKGSPLGLQIVLRVGCNIFVAPQGLTDPPVMMTGMSLRGAPEAGQNVANVSLGNNPKAPAAPAKQANGPDPAKYQAFVTLKNSGRSSVRTNGTVNVKDITGKVVAEGKLEPANALLPPGTVRDFWLEWDNPLPPGQYHVSAKAQYGIAGSIAGELDAVVSAAPAPKRPTTPEIR